jgi:hypothetical protein
MTEAEANTLTVDDEIYHGAHKGVVVGVTRDKVTIRWSPLKLSKGPWNDNCPKCRMGGLTSPIKAPKPAYRRPPEETPTTDSGLMTPEEPHQIAWGDVSFEMEIQEVEPTTWVDEPEGEKRANHSGRTLNL